MGAHITGLLDKESKLLHTMQQKNLYSISLHKFACQQYPSSRSILVARAVVCAGLLMLLLVGRGPAFHLHNERPTSKQTLVLVHCHKLCSATSFRFALLLGVTLQSTASLAISRCYPISTESRLQGSPDICDNLKWQSFMYSITPLFHPLGPREPEFHKCIPEVVCNLEEPLWNHCHTTKGVQVGVQIQSEDDEVVRHQSEEIREIR